LVRRSAGRLAVLIALLASSCVISPQEKPLNPKLLFTIGSSFLAKASSIALKGHIEFSDGRSSQSGGFQMYLTGYDSLSFVIEGPLGADVFRMVVLDTTAYLLSNNDQGWVTLGRLERASVAEYGIDNISPFETGIVILPQYFMDSCSDATEGTLSLHYRDQHYLCVNDNDFRRFTIQAKNGKIISGYSRPQKFGDGFYPAKIDIFSPYGNWKILLTIENIRVNPLIPLKAWERK